MRFIYAVFYGIDAVDNYSLEWRDILQRNHPTSAAIMIACSVLYLANLTPVCLSNSCYCA